MKRRLERLVMYQGDFMRVNTLPLTIYIIEGGGFIRVFGYGFAWKDTNKIPLFFSERNGYQRHWMIGRWSFRLLRGA